MLNWLTVLLPLAVQFAGMIPAIANAWNTATGNSLQKVATTVTATASPALLTQLEQMGASAFPNLSPTLHAAAAALLAAESHTGAVAWLQSALNIAESAGFVAFEGNASGPNSALIVDGMFGPRTQAAVLALQAKMGVPTTGMFADAEVSALQALLAKA